MADQRLDHLIGPDLGDPAALDVDEPAFVPGDQGDVGVGGLAGAVDDAAHDGHLHGLLDFSKLLFHPGRHFGQIDPASPARRATDQLRGGRSSAGRSRPGSVWPRTPLRPDRR